MSTEEVMKREQEGLPPGACCFAEDVLRAFFSNRTCDHTPGSGRIIDLSRDFFQLGAFVDWLAPQRDHFLEQKRQFDEILKDMIFKLRAKHKKNSGWLDQALPQPQFDPSRAATFAFVGLLRGLIGDSGHQVKDGDAMDFHHAVMSCAFANFAALDKHWKIGSGGLPICRNQTELRVSIINRNLRRWSRTSNPDYHN